MIYLEQEFQRRKAPVACMNDSLDNDIYLFLFNTVVILPRHGVGKLLSIE